MLVIWLSEDLRSPVKMDWPLSALEVSFEWPPPTPTTQTPSLSTSPPSLSLPSFYAPPPTPAIPLSFPTLTSKHKTLEGVLEHPALECECVNMHLCACVCVSMCALPGYVGLLFCLLFVGLLWGMMRPGLWRAGSCAFQTGYDIRRLQWQPREVSLTNGVPQRWVQGPSKVHILAS